MDEYFENLGGENIKTWNFDLDRCSSQVQIGFRENV